MGRSATIGMLEVTIIENACWGSPGAMPRSLSTLVVKRVLGATVYILVTAAWFSKRYCTVTVAVWLALGLRMVRYSVKVPPALPSAKYQVVLAGAERKPFFAVASFSR